MQDPRVGKRPIRSLSIPEKMDAITRVRSGESKASVARDIGVPESTLRGWCKAENKIRNLARRTSSPNSNPTSPASSNGTEPVLNPTGSLSSGEDEDLGRSGAPKRRRMDNGHAVPSTSSYSPTHSTEHVESKPKVDYMNTLINTLMSSGVRSDNSILLQQLAAQNAATLTKNLMAYQSNGIAGGLVPQTVGLVENGLQYTKSSNGHSNKRHSLASASHYSAIAPTTQMDNKASRKSMPAAAEAPATPVPASPRKTNEYQNGLVGQQHAYQSTTSARSSKKESSSSHTTATTCSASTSYTTSTSNSNSLFGRSDESLWLWLAQQQHLLGQQTPMSFNPQVDSTASWFWQWYTQCSAMTNAAQLSAVTGAGSSSGRSTPTPTPTPTPAHKQQSTPLSMRSPTKAKAVLDRILYSNNNNNYNNYNDETETGARRTLDLSNKTAEGETATEPSEAAAGFHNMTNDEAILHGQKFAAWMANSSDPAVSRLYVLQIQYLLNKLTTIMPPREDFKQNRK